MDTFLATTDSDFIIREDQQPIRPSLNSNANELIRISVSLIKCLIIKPSLMALFFFRFFLYFVW